MINWSRYLPGVAQDDEAEDPIAKTLRLLQQPFQGGTLGRSASDIGGDLGAGISQGVQDLGTGLSSAASSVTDALGSGLSSAAQTVSDAYSVPTEQRPPQYSGPSYAQPRRAEGQPSMLEQLPDVASAARQGAADALGDRGALLAGMRQPETAEEAISTAAPAPYRAMQIASEAGQRAGAAGLGEYAERASGTEPAFTTNPIETPLGTIPSVTGPTPRQVGETVGSFLGDPTTYLGVGAAGRAADLAIEHGAGALRGAAGRAVGSAAEKYLPSTASTGLGSALGRTAERVPPPALADEGVQLLGSGLVPRGPGRPTVETLREQLDTATAAWQRARDAGDEQLAALAREHAVASDLADATNARRSLEPAITSDMGRRVESLPVASETADTLSGAGSRRADTADLGGPISHVPELFSLNAGLGPTPGAGLANAAQGAVVGAASEDLQAQAEGREPDPTSRLARGAIGAGLGYVAGRHLPRPPAETAELGAGFVARFPGVQGALTAAQQRAASMQARGVQPLGPLQWMRKAAGEVGYSSMIGPTTFTASMLGGPIEAAWNVPKRVLGAALPKGVGGRAAPAEGLTIAQGALRGLGEVGTDIVDALRGQGGNIADALAGRGRYAAVPGHEPLSQQTVNPIGHAVATGLEAGGRFWSGLPDAIYGTIGRRVGEHQAAAEAATSAGLSGSAWKQHVDALLADVENVKSGQSPSMSGTQDVIAAGERAGKHSTYQDELGTYGEAAKKWASIPLIPDGKGGTKPVPVVGNMISPFFNTPWNMELRLAEKTPGVGALLNTQKGFDKAYDQVVGTALVAGMGTYAASGHITGSGPDDPEKKRMLMATGWRPYSTAIGGYYVPNRVLGEFGPLLNAVGDAHDAMVYSKDQSPAGIAGNFGARFGQQLQQRVWLQGLSELIKALDTGQQGGLGAGAERYAAGLATRMVPYAATARSVLTSEDPWARTTDRGPGTTALGRIGQQVQQGVGLGQGIEAAGIAPLPIQQDVLGRPQVNPQRGGRAAFVKVGEDRPDPTIRAFQAAGVDLGAPPNALTMSRVPGVPITPAERRRWEQARGEYLIEATAAYTANPDFQSLPPEKQAPYLQSLLGKANAHASSVVQSEMDPEERQRRVTETARKKAS